MRKLAGAEYHQARAAMEMERAAQAADPKTAALHRQLAELHLLSAEAGQDLEQTSHSPATTTGLASARG